VISKDFTHPRRRTSARSDNIAPALEKIRVSQLHPDCKR
jgi:hypothetical protein